MSNVTPEPTIARKTARHAGYGIALLVNLTLLVLMLGRLIDPTSHWVLAAPPVVGVVTYYGVWGLLGVTFEFE